MLFSRPCTYAIRALVYLAMQPPGKVTGTKEIADHEGIPNSFLGKVLLQLRRKRLLRSFKGIGGGYELAVPPPEISLLTIVRAVDGDDVFESCVLDNRDCRPSKQCALHESWLELREQLQRILEKSTVAALVQARLEDPSQSDNPDVGILPNRSTDNVSH